MQFEIINPSNKNNRITDDDTVASFLFKHLEQYGDKVEDIGNPHTHDSGRYSKRWGIINRLDRDTSGFILIAKSESVEALNFVQSGTFRTSLKPFRHSHRRYLLHCQQWLLDCEGHPQECLVQLFQPSQLQRLLLL